MSNCVKHIKQIQSNIAKLKGRCLDRKGNFVFVDGFTIDIHYGGNEEADIKNVCIGSIADYLQKDENTAKALYELMIKSLENDLKFWLDSARRDMLELQEVLNNIDKETNK